MLVTITGIEESFTKNGVEYLKVTGVTDKQQEVTKSVFDNLKDKWESLVVDSTVEFKMEKKGQFWNVVDIIPIKDSFPAQSKADAPVRDMSAMEHSAQGGKKFEQEYLVKEVEKMGGKVVDTKLRSMAVAYAKDLVASGIIDPKSIRKWADWFLRYIQDEKTDEQP